MKKEILALIDSTGVDGQQKKKHIWLGVLHLIAWKDSVLHTENKIVNWTTTYEGLVEMANIISKNMIIKIVVEDKDTHFNLLAVLPAPATDNDLELIQQKIKKPIYSKDKVLGKFKYDKQFDWFTKKVKWETENGYVYIRNAESTLLNQQFEFLANLLDSLHLQEIKQFAAKELAHLTEEWTGKSLSTPDFLKELKFKELVMNSTGDFTVYLAAGKLFADHNIQIEGNTILGLKSAYI